ncbi:hypothetical protein JCM16303_002827 [Sporobolomyces ruberrimus]
MCTANAAVVYGLTVRSASLVFAADAWTRLEDTFPFFDLVFLRRRSNSLTASLGNQAVEKLPNEVWEEIRFWLVGLEMVDSEYKLLEPFCCPMYDDADPLARKPVRWIDQEKVERCEVHDTAFYEWVYLNIGRWQSAGRSNIDALLSRFGLERACGCPISIDDYPGSDDLALISVPSRFTRGDFERSIVTADCGGGQDPDQQTIVDVSFKLPPNVNQRFKQLVRLFNLEVVESSINKVSSKPAPKAQVQATKKTTKAKCNGIKNKVSKEIRPRWLLWTTCELAN